MFFSKKNTKKKDLKFNFSSGNQSNFNFDVLSINPRTISVSLNGKSVATFERWEIILGKSPVLKVTHFATTGESAGKGYGEGILRAFAAGIKRGSPEIKEITFALSSSPTKLNLKQESDQELARARVKLFTAVGMEGIVAKPEEQGKITTSGTWKQDRW